VRVVDDSGKILPERTIGEIVLKSNSMFTEYYRRPELTDAALRDGWFYTSDMGYIADGELYVLGRKDDMIIVGGRNIYPQDVEEIAHRVQGVYQGRAAAFGIDDKKLGTASIVLVCELRGDPNAEDLERIESQLRRNVVAELDVILADVRFVERGWVVKTSNGKIARRDNRDKYFTTLREPIGGGGMADRIGR
jgi:acyl-CoA synthetase (AMP-forming)/AMP-acid ligase II